MTWEEIFQRWDLVHADLISEYGVDVADRAMMRATPWSSLKVMIAGLCSADTRLSRALGDQKK